MTAQPPHNNRPDNQADWLDEILENGLYLESYVYDALPGGQQVTGKVVRLKPEAKAAITTKIAEAELLLLRGWVTDLAYAVGYTDVGQGEPPKYLKNQLDYVERRINELEALKEKNG